jgi:hypothetical protein
VRGLYGHQLGYELTLIVVGELQRSQVCRLLQEWLDTKRRLARCADGEGMGVIPVAAKRPI